MNDRIAFCAVGVVAVIVTGIGSAPARDPCVAKQMDDLDAFNAQGPGKTRWSMTETGHWR